MVIVTSTVTVTEDSFGLVVGKAGGATWVLSMQQSGVREGAEIRNGRWEGWCEGRLACGDSHSLCFCICDVWNFGMNYGSTVMLIGYLMLCWKSRSK